MRTAIWRESRKKLARQPPRTNSQDLRTSAKSYRSTRERQDSESGCCCVKRIFCGAKRKRVLEWTQTNYLLDKYLDC